MSSRGHPDRQAVERLLDELEDGTIRPDDRARLMELMRDDASIREIYLEHRQLSALIHESAESKDELGTMPISIETLRREKRRSALLSLGYAAAALVMLGLGLLVYQVSRPEPPSSWIALEGSNDAAYAVVRDGTDEEPGGTLGPGDQVTLQRGLVRLRFPSGVEAIVEGPSQLELISETTLRMDDGIGWFRVPPEGRGFTVRTAVGQVIDLGTEFGIHFSPEGNLEVHVAQGRVEVLPSVPGAEKTALAGGEAMSFDLAGTSQPLDPRPSLFRRNFSKAIPRIHWSFDTEIRGTFPAAGTFNGVEDHALRLQRLDGDPVPRQGLQIDGMFGRALSLKGDGLFGESSYPGIENDAPRTVAAWIRHRTPAAPTNADPRTGLGAIPPAGAQAYLLNYTNAGLTTAAGATGATLEAGASYSLTCQAAALPGVGSTEYRVELVAFGPADDDFARVDSRADSSPGQVVAVAQGRIENADSPVHGRVSFTPAPDDPNLGKELGIRLVKPGTPVLYDEIRLAIHRPDQPSVLAFTEDFEAPKVAGYAEQVMPARGWIGARPGSSGIEAGYGSSNHGLFSRRPIHAAPVIAWGEPGTASAWTGYVLPGKPPIWTVMDGRGHHDAVGTDPLGPNQWIHVATVHTGRRTEDGQPEVRHYINGRPTNVRHHPGDASGTSTSESAALFLGRLPGARAGDPTLDADIDELHILRAALGAQEIRQLMEENRAVLGKD